MFDLIGMCFKAYWFWFIVGFVVLFFCFLCWKFRKVWLGVVGGVLISLLLVFQPCLYAIADIYFDWSYCKVAKGVLVGTEDQGSSGRLVLCLDDYRSFREGKVRRVMPFGMDGYESGQSVVVLIEYHAITAIGIMYSNSEDAWYGSFRGINVADCVSIGDVSDEVFLDAWDVVCDELSFVY